jgi:CelD/BcsL family acetyltransferase involved in cellulose biosynthesis
MHVAVVHCGARVIFVGIGFDDGQTTYLYNAGIDPAEEKASPGITGVALLFQERIASGTRRFDFLRGQERYKYEWGAVDEPIYRLLVTRRTDSAAL